MQTPSGMERKKRFCFVVRALLKGRVIDPILLPKILQGNDTDVIAGRHFCSKRALYQSGRGQQQKT